MDFGTSAQEAKVSYFAFLLEPIFKDEVLARQNIFQSFFFFSFCVAVGQKNRND